MDVRLGAERGPALGAKVLVIGLDAAEPTLLERWATTGACPTIARLADRGVTAALGNSLETLPGAIWPELATGISGGRLGLYYHPKQFHTGEATPRPVTPEDVDPDAYYWSVAGRAGRRVAVVDVPQTVPCADVNGVHVTEWGLHDRNFAIASTPRDLIDDLRQRHGDHPVTSCDAFHHRTIEGYRALRTALLDGVARKTDLLLDVLGAEDWDLFTCSFGESHCVGHQFWHFFDSSHPRHPEDTPEDLASTIEDVYRALDRGVGALVDAAGPEAQVLVVASHGMGPKIGGPQLLPEVLVRLGLGRNAGVRLRARTLVPRPLRERIARLVPRSVLDGAGVTVATRSRALDSPAIKAVAVNNNRCGGIRLNIVGREPFGSVRPGADADAVVAALRGALLELRDPATTEPIVERVVTAAEAFGPDRHPDLPDVIVVFRTDLGPLESCESSRIGRVDEPIMTPSLPRTGDHHPASRLWAIGPRLIGPARVPDANVLDIAPTVLDLLGVPVPDAIDGRTLARHLVGV